MNDSNFNVLEKINSVMYKGEKIEEEMVEEFFNRRKRRMIFFIENELISHVKPENYGYIKIFYKDGKDVTIQGKIVNYAKSKYDEDYFLGISIVSRKDISKNNLTIKELTEACIFLKRYNNLDVVYPDLRVVLDSSSKVLEIPFYNCDDELVFIQMMSREQALGIKT
jgi:hypothetical protein